MLQFRIIVEKVICANSSTCSSQFCGLHLKSRYERHINLWCDLSSPLENIAVHYRVHYRIRNVYHKFLIEGTEDVCNLLQWYYDKEEKSKHSVGKMAEILAPVIMPYAHFINRKCPIVGNVSLTNAIINEYYVPSLMPTGQYRVDFNIFSKGIIYFQPFILQVFASIVSQATPVKQVGVFNAEKAVFDTI